ncbi:MAG: hypothetical protein REH83_04305 [Rickettsiella sp.]|nr:hypothetical protein [Rickettsiella sp.]
MSKNSLIKTSFLSFTLLASTLSTPSYATDPSDVSGGIDSLVAGFGRGSIKAGVMWQEPTNNAVTISTDIAQATYLLSPNSPFVGPLTQKLLSQLASGGKDPTNDIYSFTWIPNAKPDLQIDKEPLKSIDVNSLLQPITYKNDLESNEAKNVIDALSGSLSPLNTINFNQLVANLSGDKANNIKAKLNEKQIQAYLSALRSYTATQTIALSNLYQLFTERQAIDPKTLPSNLKTAFEAVNGQVKGPLSTLQLENFMATRRIIDKNWHKGLLDENPAALQREQTQLLAENLAESYQTRMTLERLLATMSVLVLEFNAQIRTQLQNQIQNINNPAQNSGS